MNVTVMSDGAWGTAIALTLLNNDHHVTMWGPFPDYLEKMRVERVNSRFLPGIELPSELAFAADPGEAIAGTELVVMAAPTQYVRGAANLLAAAALDPTVPIVNVAKGIELGTLKRISEIIADELGNNPYLALAGPSHAEEVAKRVPTAVVAAAHDRALAKRVQTAFLTPNFRVYTSPDPVGVELGGALKNVYAIAAGICDGMQLGDNPKAALITRGIAEMARLGNALGGHPETFAGLAGVGDMIVTCTSGHSRNRHVGEELGRGKTLDQVTAAMGMVVAEGVKTAQSAFELAREVGVETPIIHNVYAALYEDKDPRAVVRDLMERDPKGEFE